AELTEVLNGAEADDGVGSVVLAGNAKAFFAGFDLGVIRGGDPKAIAEMTTAGGAFVREAYGAAVPVVAASTGHAVAAGALMLLGCDHRVGVDGPVKIGLNEVAIALTLPDWAIAIAKERISRRHLQRCVANSVLLDGQGAVDAGYLDEAVPPDQVVDRAVEVAAGLAESLDPRAYRNTVHKLRSSVLAEMDASVAADRKVAGL
ncbi:MAG: crotonase/enoyl-CoA hydratase family protein, partial [Actinomycetota bacterium]|nr:crotonase/enoyl-CoA hydratase family protein [Actinomycetota bacterium]